MQRYRSYEKGNKEVLKNIQVVKLRTNKYEKKTT